MQPNLLEVMKARAGIPTNDLFAMLWAQKIRAGQSRVQALTGIPPLTFNANGKPLVSWSMKGNGQQTGTPTPDNPVMPEFVGVRTGNLAQSVEQGGITNVGEKTTASTRIRVKADVFPNTTYTFASNKPISIISGFTGETFAHTIISPAGFPTQYTFTTGEDDTVVYVTLRNEDNTTIRPADLSGAMLNLGSTALPYEPYGWKIPFTCAGQTVPVYLGQVSTVRRIKKLVLTGDEIGVNKRTSPENSYSVSIDLNNWPASITGRGLSSHFVRNITVANMNDGEFYVGSTAFSFRINTCANVNEFRQYLRDEYAAGHPVTVWYVLAEPTTGIVNEPLCKIGDYADELHSADAGVTIPTAKGSNTLTVDTELQPSEMTITFKG